MTQNQYNKFTYMRSMGFNKNTAYQHRNTNQRTLDRILHLIVIEGRLPSNALQTVLTASPSHRRRPVSKSSSNYTATTIKTTYIGRLKNFARNRKKGGAVIR